MAVGRLDDIGAKYDDPESGESRSNIRTPVIDLFLSNRGDEAANLFEVELRIRKMEELAECSGAGEGVIMTHYYPIQLPRHAQQLPLTVRRTLREVVNPHARDRLTLVLGAETNGILTNSPSMLYQIDIYVKHGSDVSRPAGLLRAGTAILASPLPDRLHTFIDNPFDSSSTGCARKNLRRLTSFLKLGGEHPRVLDEIIAEVAPRIAAAAAPAREICAEDLREPHVRFLNFSELCAKYSRNQLYVRVATWPGAHLTNIGFTTLKIEMATVDQGAQFVLESSLSNAGDVKSCLSREGDSQLQCVEEVAARWSDRDIVIELPTHYFSFYPQLKISATVQNGRVQEEDRLPNSGSLRVLQGL